MGEEATTQVTESAPADTGQTQDAAQAEQSEAQGQEVTQAKVDSSGNNASSEGRPGRNVSRAQERIIEKAIQRHLQSALAPVLERLSPPATEKKDSPSPLGPVDYNNLDGWLQNAVQTLLEQRLAKALPEKLNEFEGRLKTVSKTQEARNYLLSQEDVGEDEAKLSEIEEIMKREMLDYAATHQPLRAVKKAVEIWRRERKNPNAPTKAQLGTVAGGTATAGARKTLNVDQMKKLQAQLAAGLPVDEQEKLYKEIDALIASSA